MSKNSCWLIGLALIGSATLLLLLAAFDWASWVCRLPAGEPEKILASGPIGCAEFWLNWYQTLIAGLLALLAAGYTVMITRKQVVLTQKSVVQSQIVSMKSAYKQATEARSMIESLDETIGDFTAVFMEIEDKYLVIPEHYANEIVTEASRKLVRYANDILTVIRVGGADQDSEAAACEFLKLCKSAAEYKEVFEDFFPHFRFARDVIKKHNPEHDFEIKILASEELSRLRQLVASVSSEGNALRQAAKGLRDALNKSLSSQMEAINLSEQQAKV